MDVQCMSSIAQVPREFWSVPLSLSILSLLSVAIPIMVYIAWKKDAEERHDG